jgi:hypothetical protein
MEAAGFMPRSQHRLPWIQVSKNSPYFMTETGEPWTPLGHNDAITWPALEGIFRRSDVPAVERYLRMLARGGVACLRLMLEYSQTAERRFEEPAGTFNPDMVTLWDDMFALCEKAGMRILLTPYDTFWMWINWEWHPYNRDNGGPCADRARLLLCKDTREAVKARLRFATERWGASGALFAWDIWNEIHPSYAENTADPFEEFIEEVGTYLRQLEMRLYGRAHPQTISIFGPHVVLDSRIPHSIYRHPALDFASTHFYWEGTIDAPENTVDAAIDTGRLMREALAEIRDGRPFLDSESGPIHTFKDHHITLPEPFDDEYFRHMQWAHFASGGAGGGMRWPNRHPHVLTAGMHRAQGALARFLPLIDWANFRRRNLNEEVRASGADVAVFACGDGAQAVAWLLRKDTIGAGGRLNRCARAAAVEVAIPGLAPGRYRVTLWDTLKGAAVREFEKTHAGSATLCIGAGPVRTDVALAVRRIENRG